MFTIYSEFCLTPEQCYPIKTEIPIYVTILLLGSAALLLKEIYQAIK